MCDLGTNVCYLNVYANVSMGAIESPSISILCVSEQPGSGESAPLMICPGSPESSLFENSRNQL